MNDIQCFIDRQLGLNCRFNYDNVLKRLIVSAEESFYGLQNAALPAAFDQDPPIFACRFCEASGFEHILALANEDGRVAIQDTRTVRTASKLESFQCHNNAVFDLAWMPHNMNFVTVSGDHTASLWDIAEGAPKRVLVFTHHTRSVKTAVFRRGEPSVFATGARDGHVLVWDVRAGAAPHAALRPDNCLRNCHASFAPFATRTPGSHGKRPRIDAPRAVSVTGLAFRDDVTLISCGECDGNIKVWDLRKNYNVYTREPLPKRSIPYCGSSARHGYTNLVVDEARARLYASCMDDVIYCFDVATYNPLPHRRYVGHENATFYIKAALGGDGAYLVSGSSDKRAYVWNVRGAEPVARLAGHRAEVTCAAWAPRGDLRLVTCGDDARHMIWRVGPELLEPGCDADAVARAEPPPQWGALDTTPSASRRRRVATPPSRVATPPSRAAKRARLAAEAAEPRKPKRCLADLMNTSRDPDPEPTAKRPRPDLAPAPLLPAGTKRARSPAEPTTPEKRCAPDWTYAAPPGASFMTPTKNYERRGRKPLSPRSPKPASPTAAARSPSKASPSKARVISFSTPTKDLPDFVRDGAAPHHRLMSPVKKRDTTDWLTLLLRERRGRGRAADAGVGAAGAGAGVGAGGAPLSPRESVPTRRNSVSDKTPKSVPRSRTLLKYFTVVPREK